MSEIMDSDELIERYFKCTNCFEEIVVVCVECDIKEIYCLNCGGKCEEIRD